MHKGNRSDYKGEVTKVGILESSDIQKYPKEKKLKVQQQASIALQKTNLNNISTLSVEILVYILSHLSLKDVLKVECQCKKLKESVHLYLRLMKTVDFSEEGLSPWTVQGMTDNMFSALLRKCSELRTILSFHPKHLFRRKRRGIEQLSISGVCAALSKSKVEAIEISDIFLLEEIIQYLPHIQILGPFKNRDGRFPIDPRNQLTLPTGARVTSLHLTGVVIPELPKLKHLQVLYLRFVQFTNLHPFKDFSAPSLKTFVMTHCAGPQNALKYVRLFTGLAEAQNLTRLELIRVPFLGGLLQHIIVESWKYHGYSRLVRLKIGACKSALETDLGYLMIASSESLQDLCVQPSLTKDSMFSALHLADVQFAVLNKLSLGFVDAFPSEDWKNEDLVAHGLADVLELPGLISDAGMRTVGECFPCVKILEIYNCPHLQKPFSWFTSGQMYWLNITELTLRRCHAISLEDFCNFVRFLPHLTILHLEQMFKEPPKGCSRVGLSAGTGLGVSGGLITANRHAANQQAANQQLRNQNAADQQVANQNEANHAANQNAANQQRANQNETNQLADIQNAANQQVASQNETNQHAANQNIDDRNEANLCASIQNETDQEFDDQNEADSTNHNVEDKNQNNKNNAQSNDCNHNFIQNNDPNRDTRNHVLADTTGNIAVIQNGPRDRSIIIPIVHEVRDGDVNITIGVGNKVQNDLTDGNSNVPFVASDVEDAEFFLYDSGDDGNSDDEAEKSLKSDDRGSIAMGDEEEEPIKVLAGKNMYGDKDNNIKRKIKSNKTGRTSESVTQNAKTVEEYCNEIRYADSCKGLVSLRQRDMSGAYDNFTSCTSSRLDLDCTGTSNCHMSQKLMPISKVGILNHDTSQSEQTSPSESRTVDSFYDDGSDNNVSQPSEKSFGEYWNEKTIAGHDVKVHQTSCTENLEREPHAELCQSDLICINGSVGMVTELPLSSIYDTDNTNSGTDTSLVGEKSECRNNGDLPFREQAIMGDKQLATSPHPVQEEIRNITYTESVEDYLDSGIKISGRSEIKYLPKGDSKLICTAASSFLEEDLEFLSSSQVANHENYCHRDEDDDMSKNFVDSSFSSDRSCQENETKKSKCLKHQFVHSSRTFVSSELNRGKNNNLHSDNAGMPVSSLSLSYERKKEQSSQDRSSSVVCDKMLHSSDKISNNSGFNSKEELATVSVCVNYSEKKTPLVETGTEVRKGKSLTGKKKGLVNKIKEAQRSLSSLKESLSTPCYNTIPRQVDLENLNHHVKQRCCRCKKVIILPLVCTCNKKDSSSLASSEEIREAAKLLKNMEANSAMMSNEDSSLGTCKVLTGRSSGISNGENESHQMKKAYMNDSRTQCKIHKRWKGETSDQATSTSDPVVEDDCVQVLRLKSEQLQCVTLKMVGITDLVLETCPNLEFITASGCRVLKKVSIQTCPRVKRVTVSQCRKFDEEHLLDQVYQLPPEQSRLVILRPLHEIKNYEHLLRQNLKDYDYGSCYLYDFSPVPSETLYNRHRMESWMNLLEIFNLFTMFVYGIPQYRPLENPNKGLYFFSGENENGSEWNIETDIPWLPALDMLPNLDDKDIPISNHRNKGVYCPEAKGHSSSSMSKLEEDIQDVILHEVQSQVGLHKHAIYVYTNMCDTSGTPVADHLLPY
ncbi:hypothetical protein ACJMK2_039745 [Sinanodonta woodiana]|uniref:F-box only protein 38 n=1 Tax=Sinanodonta woodiana TaxID=1069815 RepID=A0ABD3WD25_SINWO